MEQEETLHQGSSIHTEYEGVNYDEVSGSPLEGNAMDDESNALQVL